MASIVLLLFCHRVVSDSVIPLNVFLQASLFMGFPRQEKWSGLSFPFPQDLPTQGLKTGLLHWQADSSSSEPPGDIDVCIKDMSKVLQNTYKYSLKTSTVDR